MTHTLVLVRHGHAAAGWGDDADPGLSPTGRAQASAMAEALSPIGPLPLVVSPLRRCRDTAAALEAVWGVDARVDPRVGEVVAPAAHAALEDRPAWLAAAMAGAWADLDAERRLWRDTVVEALAGTTEDTVVVTHFIAINAAVGAATGTDQVVSFRPAPCSRTLLGVDAGRLTVVELGVEGESEVR